MGLLNGTSMHSAKGKRRNGDTGDRLFFKGEARRKRRIENIRIGIIVAEGYIDLENSQRFVAGENADVQAQQHYLYRRSRKGSQDL